MKIVILGFAGQGRAAYEYWNQPENEITICDLDAKIEAPEGTDKQTGPDYLRDLDRFDLLIRTPALHPRDIAKANPDHPEVLTKVTTVTNEFFKVCPSRNIIGVTGTKGKGTTSTLIAKILEAAGKKVHLGGNIGIPPLEMLKNNIDPDDWVVLELANFQLIDLKYSPAMAVCLMVEPEHMDWHDSLEEYIGAKQQLFVHQKPDDIAVFYPLNENSKQVVSVSPAQKIPYMQEPGAIVESDSIVIDDQEICKTSDLKLLGKHNWQNVCAAITTVWQITQDINSISNIARTFNGLPFRIEFRQEKNGIRYFNDSFATAPGASMAAIESVPGMKVMIMGGFDRGLDLTELASKINERASELRKVVLIGQASDRLAEALKAKGFTNFTELRQKDMNQIVSLAKNEAKDGDAVVLSPGFASFDMFKNFEERGHAFNSAVEQL